MRSGVLLFLSAAMCMLEQGTCQLCYSCIVRDNTSQTSANLTGCATVNCNFYGGCAKLQLSAVYPNQQGINETVFITYRDCGTNENQCRPISQDSLGQHSALDILLQATYATVNYGKACNCNKELCNSAISSRMPTYFLPILATFLCSLFFQ